MSLLAAAILTGWASIALLYAVLFVVNAGEIVFRSASQAMIPSVVPVQAPSGPTAGSRAARR